MQSLRACLLAAGLAASHAESGTWHFVDVTQVVCVGGPGEVTIELPLSNIGAPAKYEPHVLTLFRVSHEAVNLTYQLTDSASPNVPVTRLPGHWIDARTVSLRALSNGSRRLRAVGDDAEAEDEADNEQEEEVEESSASSRREGRPRQLSGKGGFGGSRRRAGGGTFGSRRRAGGVVGTPRRRNAPSIGARRRGAPPQTGSRRRTYGAGGSRWGNNQNPAVGSYGYTNQASLNSNFGGRPPLQTPYGYSGANAYRPGGGSLGKIALAVGGGMLAGTMAAYLFNRWSRGFGFGQCTSPSGQQYANCEECRRANPAPTCTETFGAISSQCASSTGHFYATCEECRKANPGPLCVADNFGLPVSAGRDDLMTTGFIPADRTGPLRLRISSIQGADFLPASVCPPAGWTPGAALANATNATNATNVTWAPSAKQAIFVTLTRLEALGNPGANADAAAGGSFLSPGLIGLIAVVGSCLVVACLSVACLRKRQTTW